MEAAPAGQLPDSFDRVELRAVGREEVEPELAGVAIPPRKVKSGMMVGGVVRDDDDPTVPTLSPLPELPEEGIAGRCVEGVRFAPIDEAAIAKPDGAIVLDALARRVVKEHRVLHLGRNPHTTSGSVLLEVDLIHGPQVHARVRRQGAQFFYAQVEAQGRRALFEAAAFEA